MEKHFSILNQFLPKFLVFFLMVFPLFNGITSSVIADASSSKLLEQAANHINRGIDLYKESDFSGSIIELNKGLTILEKSINRIKARKELIEAHLHLGLAYIGMNQINDAKKQFKEVISIDSNYSLNPSEYSNKVISIFNEAKAEYLSLFLKKQEKISKPATAIPKIDTSPPEKEKSNKPFYKKWWVWTLAGVGIVGAGAAIAGNSNNKNSTPEPLFSDDFDDGDFNGWIATSGVHNWSVKNGLLTHSQSDENNYDLIQTGYNDWKIGEFTLDMTNFQGTHSYEIYILFGFIDENNTMFVSFSYDDLWLGRLRNGIEIYSESTDFQLTKGKNYHIKIKIDEYRVSLYVNNDLILKRGYTNPIVGRIALEATSETPIQFDNVYVWDFDDAQQADTQGLDNTKKLSKINIISFKRKTKRKRAVKR